MHKKKGRVVIMTLKDRKAEIEREIILRCLNKIKDETFLGISTRFQAVLERNILKAVKMAFQEGAELQKEEILKIIKGIRTETRCSDCGVDVPCDDCNMVLGVLDDLEQKINQLGESR